MPLAQVIIPDSLDQFRQKVNLAINQINTLSGSGSILSITSPNPGDVLIYNGSVFRNIAMSGDVTVDQNGVATIVAGTAITKGRLAFAGSRKGLY